MSFSIQPPLSCVRSTNEALSIGERRHRPTFSLQLDILPTLSFSVTQSQSTTPNLSPSVCSLPSPATSEGSTLLSSPTTPTDVGMWLTEADPSPRSKGPTFHHVTWHGLNTPNEFETPSYYTNSKIDHCPNSRHTSEDTNVLADLVFEKTEPKSTIASPYRIISSEIDIPSPATRDSSEEFQDHAMSMRVGDSSSERFAPRALRSRSKKPRDSHASSNPSPNRQRPLVRGYSAPTPPPGTVSECYRQLSAREIKIMKLESHRRYYICLMDGCDRLFGRKSNAENHIRAHLDDKPFVCSLDTCKAAFVRKGDLLRHEEIHRPSRVHTCSCGQTFSRNDALTKHIRKGICGPGGCPVYPQ